MIKIMEIQENEKIKEIINGIIKNDVYTKIAGKVITGEYELNFFFFFIFLAP